MDENVLDSSLRLIHLEYLRFMLYPVFRVIITYYLADVMQLKNFVLIFFVICFSVSEAQISPGLGKLPESILKDTIIKFPASPAAGFNFEYLVYFPKGLKSNEENYLMVETNNNGLNDSISYHERGARHSAGKSGVGNYVAKMMKIPLLIPIFPRSQTNWTVYTHALDRDAFLIKGVDIERLDLQLLAMIDDARKQLASHGFTLKQKFFMTGFSASGTFANRMSLLHPERIQAVAAGGINAIAILPVKKVNGQELQFPLGIADIKDVTGKKVNIKAFKKLPQLLYMGALDDNDAAAFSDGYNESERKQIYELMGKQMIPNRWAFIEEIYRKKKIQAEFRTYPGIGHSTDLKILNDLVEFFRSKVSSPI